MSASHFAMLVDMPQAPWIFGRMSLGGRSMRAAAFLLFAALFGNTHSQADTRNDSVLMQGNRAGQQTVAVNNDGSVRAEYSYNDRDHGDRLTAMWTLDTAGIPIAYESRGNDYSKAPVEERLLVKRGKASWSNRHESGAQTLHAAAFYMPANPLPEFYGVLARALLKAPNRRLALLPSGSASIEPAGSVVVGGGDGGERTEWFQYRITGLDFMPMSVWLDAKGATRAVVGLWLSTIVASHEADVSELLSKQDATNQAWFARLAAALTQTPKGDLLIRNARLFDPRDLSVTPGMTVLVRGERVVRVAPDQQVSAGNGALIIDAQGRFLMPGLWDCHAHFDGHVPAFMSARQFIEAGADEIQHFNYVELNFLYPQVQETTKMSERFIKVAAHAREFTPEKAEVRDFIDFLKRHRTVLDPTMGLLEARLAGSSTQITPGLENIAPRFPAQVRRNLVAPAYEAPAGEEAAYREAIPSMLKLLKALHDAGATIIPGTDALAGYQLHHELELYARAGIPPAEVLRLATLTPAEVMGVANDRGIIAAGKYADMVLIDGDPTHAIDDVRKVTTVIKGGRIYDSAGIERALGIEPRIAPTGRAPIP